MAPCENPGRYLRTTEDGDLQFGGASNHIKSTTIQRKRKRKSRDKYRCGTEARVEEGGTIKVEMDRSFRQCFSRQESWHSQPTPVFSTICKPNWPKGDAQKVTIPQRVKTINVRGEKAGGRTFPMIRRGRVIHWRAQDGLRTLWIPLQIATHF